MIYLFHGLDELSMSEAVQRLVAAALPTETADLNLTRLQGAEVTIDALRFACEAAPFLADRRAVVVHRLLARLAGRSGRDGRDERDGKEGSVREGDKALAAELAAYLPQVPANALLILVETGAPPRSGPLAKAIEAAGVKIKAFPLPAGPALVRWIKDRARAMGVQIAEPAAHLLATYVGADLRALANEIAKLAAYAGPSRKIEPEAVTLLVSQATEGNVFELVDAIGQGNRRLALAALQVLLQHGERPERIMAMIARQVRLLLQVEDMSRRGLSQEVIARELGLPAYPLRKITEQAHLFHSRQLEAMHRRVLEADLQIKTGQLEPALALELLVAEVAGEAKAPRSARSAPARGGTTRRDG